MRPEVLRAAGEASLSAAVMILALLALRLRFQDRTPRRVFCLLWDIVLVRLLLPVEIPSPLSIRRLAADVAAHAAVPAAPSVIASWTESGLVERGEWVAWGEIIEDAAASAPVQAAAAQVPPAGRGTALTALWLAAALLLAGGFLISHLRSRRVYAVSLPCREESVADWLAAHPLRRPVQARVSDRISAPLTYGVLYPVILLPCGMDWEDQKALACILAHEHEHIRRFDALRKLFLAAALCLHWFNPLVWVMYVLANRDIELACDEAVLRGGADREQYALALLGMEERRGRWSPSGSHFSRNALEERIKAIMKRKHISITALIAVLVVMGITTTVFASAAPENDAGQQQNAPVTGYVYDHLQAVEDSGVTIMSKEDAGEKLYSVDGGNTWMSEERYQAEYGSWGDGWQVEWWTYEDYKVWLEEEKEFLQSIIGERGYTGGDGWFIWDQERVDRTITLYEEILEDIKNGALYSKTIIDKSGHTVEDVALGSDGPLSAVTATVFDENESVPAEPGPADVLALLDELRSFDINGYEWDELTYRGQLVRTLVDGAPVGNDGYSIRYVYTNPDGVVDVHTLRSVAYHPDGSYDPMGDLIGVAAAGDRHFDQGLIDCARLSGGSPAAYAYAEGNGGEGGKTFEEIFAQYAAYGLAYQPRESGRGSLTYYGEPVRSFVDLQPGGGTFSYQDPDTETGLTIYTLYGQDRNLTGLTAEPAALRDVSTQKRTLGFDCSAPVQGSVSLSFGQGLNRFHYGIDLRAEKGADVTAFADGVVSDLGYDVALGSYVVLTHADGFTTLYAHCGSISVAMGDSVVMGERIADVGASGRATGTCLHFELRDGDTWLDPEPYLFPA